MARDPRVAAFVDAALAACAPRRATMRALDGRSLRAPISALAFGKCAPEMMRGALDVLGIDRAMMIALPGRYDDLVRRGVSVRVGGHPDPAPDAAAHGDEALAFAAGAEPRGTLLVLVSGGGSALLERPAPGVSIGEIARVARALMTRGAAIDELNVVRASLSEVKGGRLAAVARAEVVTLVVEDVGGQPDLVASGPTAPFPAGDPRAVLRRHGVLLGPAAELAVARPPVRLARAPRLEVILDNSVARSAVIAHAARLGITMGDLGATLSGEARDAGSALATALARGEASVIGGETTVTVCGEGRGGRNQELVLGTYLARPDGLVAALATDGIDGASDHAGAYLDDVSWGSTARGLDARAALARNDTATFFASSGTALVTGPTGTNVADVAWAIPSFLWNPT